MPSINSIHKPCRSTRMKETVRSDNDIGEPESCCEYMKRDQKGSIYSVCIAKMDGAGLEFARGLNTGNLIHLNERNDGIESARPHPFRFAFNRVRGVAQPGRAPGSGPGGRRFKSSLPDHSLSSHRMEQPRPHSAALPLVASRSPIKFIVTQEPERLHSESVLRLSSAVRNATRALRLTFKQALAALSLSR
jgi:hypothetical protein